MALSVIPPVGVFAAVWVPELLHYYAPWKVIPDSVIQRLRTEPDELRLARIAPMRIDEPTTEPRTMVVKDAELILDGQVRSADGSLHRIGFPFDPSDLERGALSWQLRFASLEVVDVLLRAYGVSGRQKFLEAAKRVVLEWANYERSAWLPRGLLWNDHAIAERTHVLVDFWRYYRGYSKYEPDTARVVLELIGHHALLLAKRQHFTAATNHGVMQNLALLHVSVALPALPDADKYGPLALQRFGTQMQFFLSDEGVVLEHAPGYHELGLKLVQRALDHAKMLGADIPVEWIEKHEKARAFYAWILRPDGSLATIGDTDGSPTDARRAYAAASSQVNPVSRNRQGLAIYPLSGYAVWWNDLQGQKRIHDLSQVVVTWSHFPDHGHYRAQEFALAFWAVGREWWTNSGYWPYGYRFRRRAESWEGSNAPHVEGEPARTEQPVLVRQVWAEKNKIAIDLEREPSPGYRVRRQVIQAGADLWLVLDSGHDIPPSKRLRTVWTSSPEVSVEPSSNARSFRLIDPTGGDRMNVSIVAPASTRVSQLRGSEEPFGGWTTVRKRVHRTSSLSVSSSSEAPWHAVVWTFGPDIRELADSAPSLRWVDPERWSLEVLTDAHPLTIQRRGSEILVGSERLPSYPLPDTVRPREQLRKQLTSAVAQYPRHRDLLPWRVRTSYLLVALILVQWVVFAIVSKVHARYAMPLLAVTTVGWIALGFAVYFWYLT